MVLDQPGLRAPDLDGLRRVGDPEADGIAAQLRRRRPDLDERDLVRLVISEIVPGCGTQDEMVRDWLLGGPSLPPWADLDRIRAGQDFFGDWPLAVATALFCVSLPSAYAAAAGSQVLTMTSDLATGNLTRRIAETGQMLFDVMDMGRESPAALLPGGQGYLTVRGVRLLHGVVRHTLLATDWRDEWGCPINQEDLLGTLLSFTVAVFHGMDRLGISYDPEAADAYLHTWCVIAYLIGIRPDLLPLERPGAERLADQIAARHHRPSRAGSRLTAALLTEMETAMPLGLHKLPRTLLWHMLPPEVPRLLAVPAPAWWQPVLATMARTGPALRRLPGGTLVLHVPTALLGRAVLRMLVDRSLAGERPAFRIDVRTLDGLSLGTSRLRRSLRSRRRRMRQGPPRTGHRSRPDPWPDPSAREGRG